MDLKLLIVLIALPAVALCVDCENVKEGIYETGCRYYVKCENKKRIEVFCEVGEAFNKKKGRCESASKVPPPCGSEQDCSALADGLYAATEYNCKFYYGCAHGVFQGYNLCPSTLVFNEKKKNCDYPRDTKPPCGTKEGGDDDDDEDDN